MTVWNRGRERSGTASMCRLTYMIEAVAHRYPKAGEVIEEETMAGGHEHSHGKRMVPGHPAATQLATVPGGIIMAPGMKDQAGSI